MKREIQQKLALIFQHASYEKFHLAATLAATTAAMGGEVHIFLAHEALLAYVDNKEDHVPPHFSTPDFNLRYQDCLEDGKISTPSSLFHKAQELGSVKIYGCSESVNLLKIGPEKTKKLAGIIGYTTFLALASDAKLMAI